MILSKAGKRGRWHRTISVFCWNAKAYYVRLLPPNSLRPEPLSKTHDGLTPESWSSFGTSRCQRSDTRRQRLVMNDITCSSMKDHELQGGPRRVIKGNTKWYWRRLEEVSSLRRKTYPTRESKPPEMQSLVVILLCRYPEHSRQWSADYINIAIRHGEVPREGSVGTHTQKQRTSKDHQRETMPSVCAKPHSTVVFEYPTAGMPNYQPLFIFARHMYSLDVDGMVQATHTTISCQTPIN